MLIEKSFDLLRLGNVHQLRQYSLCRLRRWIAFEELFVENLVAQVDAFIADIYAWSGNQLFNLVLRLTAERTLESVI
jgi:hypothetical protein